MCYGSPVQLGWSASVQLADRLLVYGDKLAEWRMGFKLKLRIQNELLKNRIESLGDKGM